MVSTLEHCFYKMQVVRLLLAEILQNPILFAGIQVALFAAVEGYRSGKAEPPSGFVPFKVGGLYSC